MKWLVTQLPHPNLPNQSLSAVPLAFFLFYPFLSICSLTFHLYFLFLFPTFFYGTLPCTCLLSFIPVSLLVRLAQNSRFPIQRIIIFITITNTIINNYHHIFHFRTTTTKQSTKRFLTLRYSLFFKNLALCNFFLFFPSSPFQFPFYYCLPNLYVPSILKYLPYLLPSPFPFY